MWIRKLSLSTLFLCCFELLAIEVTDIVIEGNRKIEREAILSKVKTKIGFSKNDLLMDEDVRSIYSLGYFQSVSIEEEPYKNGVRLYYVVSERPTVSKIEYEGLSAIDKEDLKEIVEVKEYEVLDIPKFKTSIEKLTSKYEEKGYYLADIRYELKPDKEKNEVKVLFVINENDKVQVKSINIIGNKVIPDEDIKKVIQTQEGGAFSWLTGSGAYREAVFERDVQALGFYYGTLGYVRARFGKPEVSVSADKKWIYITFSVDEGEKYFVGSIDFSGELLFNRKELLDDCKLIQGDVFNADILRRETLKYTDQYSNLGYAFANVIPQPQIHDDTKTVDIIFNIDKGERVYVGEISITGNTRTKDKVIRRELLIQEGELFSGARKRESRENVMRLGFFDQVDFHEVTRTEESNVVDIEIKVKERSTGQLVIGAGYASGEIGFTANAQLSQNNFLGNGQVASLTAEMYTGKKFYQFNLGFHEPFVGYSLWSLGGDLYHLRRVISGPKGVNTFEETKSGFDVKLGHPVLEHTHFYVTYKLENSYVPASSIIDTSLIPINSVNGISSGVTTSVVYDKRDDRFDPREGFYWNLSSEFAGLGGDQKYIKSRGTVRFYHPIIWDFIFRLNVTGANIGGIGANQIPINEHFIVGGLFSLRGYDYLSIGPRRRISSNPSDLSQEAIKNNLMGEEIVIGGHNEFFTNIEVEFPILKEAKVRGVIFLDAGNAFDGFFRNSSPALYTNTGWGVRWFTPIGPLRFEFGYPIFNPGSPRFNFTIGPAF